PQVWTLPWHVHSRANPHGHAAFTSLAPYVFRGAIAHPRLVSLTDRTVTVTYRQVGSARLRTSHLDVMAFIHRFLQHVLPHGFMQVRHCGLLHASGALPRDTLRLLIVQAHSIGGTLTRNVPPPSLVSFGPTCGGQRRVVLRLWTSNRAFLDTG